MSARRFIFAGGFAVAVAIAPLVGAVVGKTTSPVSRTIAGPSTCTVTQTGGSSSIACFPGMTPGGSGGAPSQADITAKNAQQSRGGGLF